MSQTSSDPSPISYLRSLPLFHSLNEATIQALEAELEQAALQKGDVLFQQGDPGDTMYVLVEGRLGVRIRHEDGSENVVDELAPGATVGEMALLTGQDRVATVYALEATKLTRLSRGGFERLAESHPELLRGLTESVLPRFQRTQLSELLAQWFGELEAQELHALQQKTEWVHLEDGETLFREGEPGDTMYLVVNGRLQIIAEGAAGEEQLLGEVGRGESVGEFSVLTEEPRSGTVVAIRDTDLVRIPRSLVQQYPQMLTQVARVLVRRTQQSLGVVPARDSRTAATFTLLAGSKEVPIGIFAERLVDALNELGPTLYLSADTFDRTYGKEGASQTRQDHPTNVMLTGWLNDKESEYRYIVFEADPAWTTWTRRCIHQADHLLLVADATTDPTPSDLEQALQRLGTRAPVDLVLLQPNDIERPSGTISWLTPRSVNAHHHIRLDGREDVARLARRLTGQAVGLVLSGGGARGYAHLGMIRVLQELEVPVDMIGGTSMGALVGAGYALWQEYDPLYKAAVSFGNRKLLVDYTFPMVALTASGGVTRLYQTMFGDIQIEDLWIPFFCVSANLSLAEPVIHDRGPLWRAVRASSAIPGIFAPILEQGHVLVDGGVMNNFPVDIMHDRIEGGIIIGSNAYPPSESPSTYNFDDTISGWQMLWSRINPRARKVKAPSIFGILTRATGLNSKYQMNAMDQLADLVIHHPVAAYRSLEFDRYEEIVKTGYETSIEALQGWLQGREARVGDAA